MNHLTADHFSKELETSASAEELHKYERYFPIAKRGDDIFIGVRMGRIFSLAKQYTNMPLTEIEKLLQSPIHEYRVGAVSIMDYQARRKNTSEEQRRALYELYLKQHRHIDTWDLVDRSAIHVVGHYLFDKPRDPLYVLAKSKMMAERRTAIIATMYFISRGDVTDTFKLAELLVNDKEDLIHKGVGWALRTAGGDKLLHFLDRYASTMPRVMLRYAIEKLDKPTREKYLKQTKK